MTTEKIEGFLMGIGAGVLLAAILLVRGPRTSSLDTQDHTALEPAPVERAVTA